MQKIPQHLDYATFFRQCTILSNTEKGVLVSHPTVQDAQLGEDTRTAVDKLYRIYRQNAKALLFAFLYSQ